MGHTPNNSKSIKLVFFVIYFHCCYSEDASPISDLYMQPLFFVSWYIMIILFTDLAHTKPSTLSSKTSGTTWQYHENIMLHDVEDIMNSQWHAMGFSLVLWKKTYRSSSLIYRTFHCDICSFKFYIVSWNKNCDDLWNVVDIDHIDASFYLKHIEVLLHIITVLSSCN